MVITSRDHQGDMSQERMANGKVHSTDVSTAHHGPMADQIETSSYAYAGSGAVVEYIYNELTAVCPRTGLPDLYSLRITYIPGKLLPELKSLKMYLVGYRNVGIWHEHLANRIMNDFVEAVKPGWVRIVLTSASRGGIVTRIVRTQTPEGDDIAEALRTMDLTSSLNLSGEDTFYPDRPERKL